jgi:dTMP kinase
MLRDALQARGEKCHLTGEPTELPVGRLIRDVLQGNIRMDQRALAALYAADRIEHLHHPTEGVLHQLAQGCHVISSRYYFSSLAYQSEFVDPRMIASFNYHAKMTLPADLTIYLDLSPDESLQRIEGRGSEKELFETREKLTMVRESFHQAFDHFGEGENIHILDAARSPVEIADEIINLVDALNQ